MSSSEDANWSDVPEDLDCEGCTCLFCSYFINSLEECVTHLLVNHDFDIKILYQNQLGDIYTYIRFVNYIRERKTVADDAKVLDNVCFSDDKWLLPVIENDLFLQLDVEDFISKGVVTEGNNLKVKLSLAEERAKLAEEFLQRTIDDLNKCRKELSNLLLSGANNTSDVCCENDVDGYFGSYGHYAIHEEMLKDKVRTEAYRDFMFKNPKIFNNSLVLDVGCGTGVLSLFAAQAGARKVSSVDFSEIAYQAMDIVNENKFNKIIDVVKDKAENIKLDEKVGVIVSEWMGYFLLFESMLDTVIYCRDNLLRDGGCVYPNKCNIQLVALADDRLYSDKVNFWNDVYGFKMTSMKTATLEEPLIAVVCPDYIVSEHGILVEYDLMTVTIPKLDFNETFSMEITKDASVTAIVGYFDVDFDWACEHPIKLSSSPTVTPTHWKQTVFLLKERIEVQAGQTLDGRMICKKNKKDHRALDIGLFIYENKHDLILQQNFVMA